MSARVLLLVLSLLTPAPAGQLLSTLPTTGARIVLQASAGRRRRPGWGRGARRFPREASGLPRRPRPNHRYPTPRWDNPGWRRSPG